uniref:Secreted peptide n=1 Tax=Anopheles melas TaxID=34690 RepID=A0A182TX40_9DIPT
MILSSLRLPSEMLLPLLLALPLPPPPPVAFVPLEIVVATSDPADVRITFPFPVVLSGFMMASMLAPPPTPPPDGDDFLATIMRPTVVTIGASDIFEVDFDVLQRHAGMVVVVVAIFRCTFGCATIVVFALWFATGSANAISKDTGTVAPCRIPTSGGCAATT